MKIKPKIIHLLFILWVVLLVFRYDLIAEYFFLLINYVKLIFNDYNGALNVLNLKLIDVILSLTLFIVLPTLYFFYRKKWKILTNRLSFSYALLFILFWILIFAPLITNVNPEFSKNLTVTKLLPPLSKISTIQLSGERTELLTEKERFVTQLNSIIKLPFDEQLIFADSVQVSEAGYVTYFQKKQKQTLHKDELLLKNDKPVVQTKFFLFGTDEYGRDQRRRADEKAK